MKTIFKTQLYLLSSFLVLIISLTFNSAYAQGELASTQQNAVDLQNNIIGGYSSTYWYPQSKATPNQNIYLFTQSPSYEDNILEGYFFSRYLSQLTTTGSESQTENSSTLNPDTSLTIKALNSFLTATQTNSSIVTLKAMEQFYPLTSPEYVYNFKDGKANGPHVLAINGVTPDIASLKNSDKSNINALNLGALIDPVQYDTNKNNSSENAAYFIKYMTNQYNLIPLINFTQIISDNELTRALSDPEVQKYLLTLRQILANYSVGMNNLYYLYNERKAEPTDDILGNPSSGTQTIDKSLLPKSLQTNASPLAIEKWMATRRLTTYPDKSHDWFQQIEHATPATLQRETVFLLAEIRYEMFQQRMLQERMLATLSVQQLQSANLQQLNLQQMESNLCKNSLFKGSNVCPPPQQLPVNLK